MKFIQEYYYQLKSMHFSGNVFYREENIDVQALSNFLEGLGHDDEFTLNEILQYDENTQKTVF